VSAPRFVVDLTDLLDLLELHRVPMGVARVQIALLEAGLAPGTPSLFALTTFSEEQGRFVQVPPGLLLAVIRGAREGGPADEPAWLALQEARKTARQGALGFAFQRGDRVLALGMTGSNPMQLRRLRELRQAHGVLICVLFYDAIPLTTPEHCDISLSRSFSEHFLAMCLQMDRAVAISSCAARDFRNWQRRILPHLEIPISIMPLDAQFPKLEGAPVEELPEVLRAGRPYVLCVATIESRKNHMLLLHAWLTLLRRHGDAVIPDLVLIGRPGFQSEAVLHLMRSAPELRRRVTHLRDVGDTLLGQLYAGCLFTVFNSFYEGWGLPVTEALAHGKIPLAPDHTSLREAGGTAALYFTPQSEPELAELAWSLIRDPAHRQHLEAKIAERVRLRSWREVAEGLIATLAAEAPPQPEPAARMPFPWGQRIGFEEPVIPQLPDLMQPLDLLHQLLCEGEGWALQERWGIGAVWGKIRLRFPVLSPPPGPLILMLELAAPQEAAASLRLRVIRPGTEPGRWVTDHLPPGAAHPFRLHIAPCEPGDLVVEFDLGPMAPQEERRTRLVFLGLMLCAESDHAALLHYFSTRSGVTALRLD
jgi:glycosyltransferase involved in cell wall biosynthesis